MLIRPDVFSRLCRARQALTETPESPVSVDEVAREARISRFHFIDADGCGNLIQLYQVA